MGNGKKRRDINRMLDGYLDARPGNRRTISDHIDNILSFRPKWAARQRKLQTEQPVEQSEIREVEELVGEDLQEFDEEEDQPMMTVAEGTTLFDRFNRFLENFIFRSSAQSGHLGDLEVVDIPEEHLPEDAEAPDELPEEIIHHQENNGFRGFFSRFFASREIIDHDPEEDARVTKLVLYKDRTEKEVRFLVRLIDSLMPRVYKRTRDEFTSTKDYQVYQSIRKRYVIDDE